MMSLLFNSLAVETYQMLRARGLAGKDIVGEVNFMPAAAATDIYDPRPHKADCSNAGPRRRLDRPATRIEWTPD